MSFRTGIGYDIHRIVPDRELRLGGLTLPAAFGLLGHSDADVVLHALCDALLGAAGLGDIGELFPDTDPTHRNADSRHFLAEVLLRLKARKLRVVNVDVTILAEQPKLGSFKPKLRAALAGQLDLPEDAVSVKAATNEGLDAVGRGEAIACWAAALLSDAT
jgi:2-C-methyl-D-erythritol 2,4-cyclodiphosphate synthase